MPRNTLYERVPQARLHFRLQRHAQKYPKRVRLPGEAAPIERIIEGFAKGFFEAQSKSMTIQSEETSQAGDPFNFGWYVCQPMSGGKPCCASCGKVEQQRKAEIELEACWGCKEIHFCASCRRGAGAMGHAIRGKIGYGRACVAAREAAGTLITKEGSTHITFWDFTARGERAVAVVPESESLRWQRRSPFRTADSVFGAHTAIRPSQSPCLTSSRLARSRYLHFAPPLTDVWQFCLTLSSCSLPTCTTPAYLAKTK